MSESVSAALKKIGPSLTSDVIARFVASGMSEAAARKKISRAQSSYVRLAGVRFAKNARFIYLEEQWGTKEFWEALEGAFQKAGKAYWSTIVSLKARGGRCKKSHFPIVAGAPIARKAQLSPERILERLCQVQFLKLVMDENGEENEVSFAPLYYHQENSAEQNAIAVAERIALFAVKEWARRFGLGSFNKFQMRDDDELPLVSGIAWDLSAPSYVRPLVSLTSSGAKPGFLVCDINLYEATDTDAVAAFVRKHDLASAPSNVSPIMPMLIGQVFTESAFSLAKQKGIIALTLDNIFGQEIAKALKELIALLSDLGARAAVDPAKIDIVMNTLTRIEGAAINVRGSLFEITIGSLVKDVEGGFLKIGEERYDYISGRKAEIDVQLDRGAGEGVLILECKSKIPGARATLAEVQKWYEDRVPLIYSILSSGGTYTGKTFRFEFWTNGPINDDAVEWLQKQNTEFDNYSVGWRDGQAVKDYADRSKTTALKKILKEHYFNHALSKVARKMRAESSV
ncbi:hypothetical protein [Henriciella marina]|uniref:hypothetical protein n=1 Tax=Henriciella marina TaxID=453851 RepID=UPI000376F900|nr:hypothetical protein [Henriciella marina]